MADTKSIDSMLAENISATNRLTVQLERFVKSFDKKTSSSKKTSNSRKNTPISDDDLDDDIGDYIEAQLTRSISTSIDKIKAKNLAPEIISKFSKLLTEQTLAFQGSKKFDKIRQKGFENFGKKFVEEYSAKGGNLDDLKDDEQELTLQRIKMFRDYAKKTKLSNDKRLDVEKNIILATEHEFIVKKRHNKNLEKVNDTFDKISDKITSVLGEGILGKTASRFLETRKEKFGGFFAKKIGPEGEFSGTFLNKILGTFSKFTVVLTLIGGILLALITRFIGLFNAALKFNAEISKTLGITKSFSTEIEPAIAAASTTFRKFIDNQQESNELAIESAAALFNEFGTIEGLLESNIEGVGVLSKRLGISTEEAAKFFAEMQLGWQLSGAETKKFVNYVKTQAEFSGVSFARVMKDISTHAEMASIYFHRSAKDIANAAIQAQIVDGSLSTAFKMADAFSSFEDSAINAFNLSVITGQKFNAMSLFTQANFGKADEFMTNMLRKLDKVDFSKLGIIRRNLLAKSVGFENIGELQKMINKLKEDDFLHDIVTGNFKIIGKDNIESYVSTLRRMKRQGIDISGVSKESAEEYAKTLSNARKKGLENRAEIETYTEIMGMEDTLDPMQNIMVGVYGLLDRFLKPMAEGIVQVVVPIMRGIGEILNIETTEEKFSRERKERIQKEGKEIAGNLKNIEILTQALDTKAISSPIRALNSSGIPILVLPGGTFKDQYFSPLTQHAEGGITTRPSIAGEAGPEAILPLTGKGVKNFTEPFLKNANMQNDKKMDELISLLKDFMNREVVIQNSTYLDSRKIAEGIVRTSLGTS